MVTLRPFFSFYGAKWRTAPRYPEPRHDAIIEPFAGSAGYSLRYPSTPRVLLVDLDEKVIGTWRYLIGAGVAEILALPDLAPGESVNDLALPQEARWLIGFWLNKGMTAPCNVPSKWMREPLPGRLETYWGAGIRERIARQLPAIRHWRAVLASAADVPDVEATWFVDPPYVGAPGRRYTHGNRSIDYADLGAWCKERRGQVIVCENVGADWLPFEPLHDAKAARNGGTGVSREAIWLGGSPW